MRCGPRTHRAGGRLRHAPFQPQLFDQKPVLRQYSLEERVRYQLWDYSWNPNPDEPISRIKISLSEQRVYIYQGSSVAGESPITTGKKGHETPPRPLFNSGQGHRPQVEPLRRFPRCPGQRGGRQRLRRHEAAAEHGLRLGRHALLHEIAGRRGRDARRLHSGTGPASHGCIRLPHAFAELLYSNVSLGTPVDIVP